MVFHWGFNLCALTINDVEHFFVLTGDNSIYLFTYLSVQRFLSISGLLLHYLNGIGEGNGTLLQYSCLENPWTEEPGRLQSMGSLRVGHD